MPSMRARWATIPDREEPFFFTKPADALATDGRFPYPPATKDVHHEIELVVALGKGGRDIPVEQALDCIWGYAVGLDMTRRDLQAVAKKAGRPWEVGQGASTRPPRSRRSCRRRQIGHPELGCDLARRQRRAAPDGRSRPADLEDRRDDQLPVRPVRAGAGRPDLHRHARRGAARCSAATGCTAMSTGWASFGSRLPPARRRPRVGARFSYPCPVPTRLSDRSARSCMARTNSPAPVPHFENTPMAWVNGMSTGCTRSRGRM